MLLTNLFNKHILSSYADLVAILATGDISTKEGSLYPPGVHAYNNFCSSDSYTLRALGIIT